MSAVTQNSYIGNGSTTNYSFTFPYLKSTDVEVQVDATVTTAWQFANATTVQFNTAPANGAKIKILRQTNVDSLTATFYAGSAIKSEDLNDNYTQNLYKTQEIGARFFSNTGGTMTGDLTMAEDTSLIFEGATDDNFETVLAVADPTADRTITLPNVTGTVVTTGDTGTVATTMIANDAITNAKIANDQIDSEHYVNGSIDTQHIADSQITSAKIANGTIVNADINSSAAIAGSKIAPTFTSNIVVTNNNPEITLQDTGNNPDYKVENVNGVFAIRDTTNSTDRLTIAANGDVTITNTLTADLADNSINSEHYVNGSIDTEHIADSQITSAKIADGTIVAGDLASNAVTTDKITDANVTTAKIADSNVTTAKIAADAITGDKIPDDAVDNEHLAANSVRSEQIQDGKVTNAKIATSAVTTTRIQDDAVTTAKIADAELKTLAGMQSGTASKLADSTALTADIADLNQIDGLTKQTTISDSDASFPTSGAVVDYVAAQIAPLGGLEVIATEVAFPNTQPQAGVVISISDAGGVVFNGSGTSTTGRTVGGSTVTINNAPSSLNSETLVAGVGLMVSSTGSGQIYNYHKILGKEDDIKQLSDDINDFNARYRVGSSNPTSALDAGDLFFNTSTSKLLVYNATNTAWEEAQSIGNFYISTLSPAFDGSTQDFTITNAPTNAEQIILSINGVIQKPNAGTSTPSEGFALSGSTVKLAAAPASGDAYFAVVIGSTVNIGTPSNNTVSTAVLQNGSVTTAKIADANVTTAKIADSNVTTAKIADANVTTAKIADSAVTSAKIADGAIVNADVNASAAIAGTKIAPDFGSQNIVTTGSITGADLEIDSDTLSVDATNNRIGIGTTSPNTKLDVRDASATGISSRSTSTQATDSNKGLRVRNNSDTDTFNVSYKGQGYFAGKVGIGTTSPTAALEISARGDVEKGIRVIDSNDAEEAPYVEVIGKRSDGNSSQCFSGKLHLARNRPDQKVTTNNMLGAVAFGGNHTDGNVSSILYSASISAIAADNFDSSTDMPTDLVFMTGSTGRTPTEVNVSAGTEHMRLTNAGALHIKSELPTISLYDTQATNRYAYLDGNSGSLTIHADKGNTGSASFIKFAVDNSVKGTISNLSHFLWANTGTLSIGDGGAIIAGNNGIHTFARNAGTGSAVLWAKGGSGQGYFLGDGDIVNTNGNYDAISDQKLKENIVDANSQWNDIKALKIRNYNFKESTGYSTHKQLGVIAQELEASGMNGLIKEIDDIKYEEGDELPEGKNIGDVKEEGYKVVSYSVLYMKAIKALQEAMAKIETLETKVAALEAA